MKNNVLFDSNHIKYSSCLLGLLFVFTFVGFQAKANHAGGGVISYKYVENGHYQFQMYFVRWCNGVVAATSFALSTNVPGLSHITMTRVDTLIEKDDCGIPLSNSGAALCAMGQGTQIFLYRSQPINFSNVPAPPASGYFFRFDLCCRGSSNNLVGESGYSISTIMYPFYVQGVAQLPMQMEDNSPLPLGWPEQLTYTANDTVIRHVAAIDPDGDEIRYHLITPQAQNNTIANYLPPYSLGGRPFTGAVQYNSRFIDSTRGAYLTSRAMISTDAIAVQLSSYRCGQRISTSIFEFPRTIAATPGAVIGDSPPQISGFGVDQTGNLYLYPKDTLVAGLSVIDSQWLYPGSIRAYIPSAISLGALQPTSNCTSPPCLVITGNTATNPTPQLPQVILNSGDTLGYGFEAQLTMNIQMYAYVGCNQYLFDGCADTIRSFYFPLIIKDSRCEANNRVELPLRLIHMELPHLNTPSLQLFGSSSGHLIWDSPLDSNLILPGTDLARSLRIQAASFIAYEVYRKSLTDTSQAPFTLAATITDINQRSWLDNISNALYYIQIVSGCDEHRGSASPVVTSFASSVSDQKLSDIRIYPNPSQGWVKLEHNENLLEISAYDVQGRLLKEFEPLLESQAGLLDLSEFSGIVLLHLKSADQHRMHKVVLQSE